MIRSGILVVAVVAGVSVAQAEESCLTCHPDVRMEFDRSVHVKGFGCTQCHGGDATLTTLDAHATGKGYIGKPARKDIPTLCASCHANVERMRASGLNTDQYAIYQESEHGMRLAAGDTRVAVCTDCHGTHAILRHTEPTSPVAQRNLPQTCSRCHSDPVLMANYKLPTDQYEKFRKSVHGVALYADEHPSAPTCASCHGAHGAVFSQVVTKACGHCHSRTLAYVDEGAHRQAISEGKMTECISCHGYHDTVRPDASLFDTACPTCHPAGSTAMNIAQKLKTVLVQTSESLAGTEAEINHLKATFPTVVRAHSRLRQADAYLLEALPLQHSLDVDRVDDLTRSARSISEDVRGAVHSVGQQSGVRLLWLAIFWFYLIGALTVLWAYRRERRRNFAAQRRNAGSR